MRGVDGKVAMRARRVRVCAGRSPAAVTGSTVSLPRILPACSQIGWSGAVEQRGGHAAVDAADRVVVLLAGLEREDHPAFGGHGGGTLASGAVHARILIALFLVAIFALGAVVLAADSSDEPDVGTGSQFEGARMPPGVRAPDFTLRNQDGERVSMRELRGQPVIVTFLYTTCEDTCPAQAQTVRGALDDLAEDVPALAIAVDPPRDTATRAKTFLAKAGALGRIDFVLGSRTALRPLWKRFFIRPQSVREEHQARFTLVDKKGFQRIGFPGDQATPETLAHDVRLLQAE